MKIEKRIKIPFTIEVKTGLHIGGSSDLVDIGELDSPVIKTRSSPYNNDQKEPYIPGSSLKGKLRSLLETYNEVKMPDKEGSCKCGDCIICTLFGSSAGNKKEEVETKKIKKARLIVRDAMLSNDENLQISEFLEEKTENKIDRITGTAKHPRIQERVIPGTKFTGDLILTQYSEDNMSELKKVLEKAVGYLNNDYLGGSGTRGYGQVVLTLDKEEEV